MGRMEERPRERPRASRVLEEIREEGRRNSASLAPNQRMEMAFSLSLEALRLCRAGLRAQGFSESEIDAIVEGRRR